MKDITIKKDGIYIRVYYKGQHMWTENTKHQSRSWGATRFRKYAMR